MQDFIKSLLRISIILATCITSLPAQAEDCSIFKSVYKPSGYPERKDGIHSTLTIAESTCEGKPCSAAKFQLNTLDKGDKLLERLTFDYLCTGTGWVCNLRLDSNEKGNPVIIDPMALSIDFKPIYSLESHEGHAPHVWVLPAINHKLRYFDWNTANFNEEIKADLPLELRLHNDTPLVWIFSACVT